jgi:hypothetical protein
MKLSADNYSLEAGHRLGGSRFVWHQDLSSASLILSNLVTIVIAVMQDWNLGVLIWIYWGQSVIIGLANFVRILSLKKFSTENFKINDEPVPPTRWTQIRTAFFFLFHYGFFHLGYLFFLRQGHPVASADLSMIGMCILIFLGNHVFSLIINIRRDLERVPNIGTMMFFPYARIIPIHLTIIFGTQMAKGTQQLIFFLALKTVADVIMHIVEHSRNQPARTKDSK